MEIIKLIEVINTWQGEGSFTGRQMLLCRFKYCDKKCNFCDTMIKMNQSAEGEYSIETLNKFLDKTKALLLTGGEPGFEPNYNSTVLMLNKLNYDVANIETNGCQIEKLLIDIDKIIQETVNKNKIIKISYSPKVFNDKALSIEIDKISEVIKSPNVILKIVPDNEYSIKLIKEVSKMTNDRGKIYLMPLGTTTEEISKNWVKTINLADEYNLNISPRMHITYNFV